MPGMSSGLGANNPTIVSAFQGALLHQGIVAIFIVTLMAVAWRVLRLVELRRAVGATGSAGGSPAWETMAFAEAPGRRLFRVGFGLLWILDGLLQAQPKMPLGMTTGVIEPAAAASPGWVQHVANAGATVWSFHPIEAPASAVWIQIGIGMWLLVAARGTWSRLAGVAATSWAAVVWVFAEAFGGIFAPGLSWLYGAPGAVVFYGLAGALVALPEERWSSARLGKAVLAAMGAFFVFMAGLQAWPGRGFWEGHLPHGRNPGNLSAMSFQMAGTPQPHLLSSWLLAFGRFDVAHGFAVNLFVVVALAVLGAVFLAGWARALPYAVGFCCLLCLADWVLVQDLGFLGGVGTDPNSMLPIVLVVMGGYRGLTRAPAPDRAVAPVTALATVQRPTQRLVAWWSALGRNPGTLLRSLISLGAVGIVLLGAAPMALASMRAQADPIIAQAIDGTPDHTHFPARDFRLVDQYGRTVDLATLHGKTVALTFLDPVCTNDCPVIGQYFRLADGMLSQSLRRQVELVAIDANPLYNAPSYVQAYDQQEGMQRLPNWLYLTGPLRSLTRVWADYGVQVSYEPGGAMIGHSEVAYIIDRHGYVRSVFDSAPGSGTTAQKSSLAVTLADAIQRTARSR